MIKYYGKNEAQFMTNTSVAAFKRKPTESTGSDQKLCFTASTARSPRVVRRVQTEQTETETNWSYLTRGTEAYVRRNGSSHRRAAA